jgi:hypothetical protein
MVDTDTSIQYNRRKSGVIIQVGAKSSFLIAPNLKFVYGFITTECSC